MDENKKADIIVSESFYHYNWLVRKNNVVIGEFKASEVINAYQSPLCFHVNEIKLKDVIGVFVRKFIYKYSIIDDIRK